MEETPFADSVLKTLGATSPTTILQLRTLYSHVGEILSHLHVRGAMNGRNRKVVGDDGPDQGSDEDNQHESFDESDQEALLLQQNHEFFCLLTDHSVDTVEDL